MPSRSTSATRIGAFSGIRKISSSLLLCLLSALCFFSLATPAKADSLDESLAAKRAAVSSSDAALAGYQDGVDAAEEKLSQSRESLTSAQSKYESAQAALAAAVAEDALRAEELAAAEEALEVAKAAVAKGEEDLAAQLKKIGVNVLETRQRNNQLMSIAMLFTDMSTGDFNNRLQWALTIYNVSQLEMDRLEEIQDGLLVAEAERSALEEKALELKAASAQAVVDNQALAATAADAEIAFQLAVQNDNQAFQDAQTMLADAQSRSAQLRAEADAIYAQIVARDTPVQPSTPAPAPIVGGGGTLLRPVNGPVTSPFGWRWHPILSYNEFHEGVDFGNACGTPIVAAESGTVSSAGWVSGYGWYVAINHGNVSGSNFATAYGHMSSYAVSAGQWVSRGQVIGYVGTTGLSTGCHLHWNTWVNGSYVNGLNYV